MPDLMITEKMKLDEAFYAFDNDKNKLKELLQTEDLSQYEFIRKYGVVEKAKFDDGESAAIQWVSTRDLDRDGEIMIPEGVVLDQYKKNPVVLWAHNYNEPPIGSDEWIKVVKGKGILAKTKYSDNDFPQEIYRLKKEGHLKAQSVGFIILESVSNGADGWTETIDGLKEKWGDEWAKWIKKTGDKVRRIITKWLLLEHSDVPVPSNPTALVEAIAKGMPFSSKAIDELHLEDYKPEITDSDIQEMTEYLDLQSTETDPERFVRFMPRVTPIKRISRTIKILDQETEYMKSYKLAKAIEKEIQRRTGKFID